MYEIIYFFSFSKEYYLTIIHRILIETIFFLLQKIFKKLFYIYFFFLRNVNLEYTYNIYEMRICKNTIIKITSKKWLYI